MGRRGFGRAYLAGDSRQVHRSGAYSDFTHRRRAPTPGANPKRAVNRHGVLAERVVGRTGCIAPFESFICSIRETVSSCCHHSGIEVRVLETQLSGNRKQQRLPLARPSSRQIDGCQVAQNFDHANCPGFRPFDGERSGYSRKRRKVAAMAHIVAALVAAGGD